MRRSRHVEIGLLGALAVALTGCGDSEQGSNETRRCVDERNVVIDESKCRSNTPVPGGAFWYFGGVGNLPGTIASGGSRTATNGEVARGGIGGTAGGAAGGSTSAS